MQKPTVKEDKPTQHTHEDNGKPVVQKNQEKDDSFDIGGRQFWYLKESSKGRGDNKETLETLTIDASAFLEWLTDHGFARTMYEEKHVFVYRVNSKIFRKIDRQYIIQYVREFISSMPETLPPYADDLYTPDHLMKLMVSQHKTIYMDNFLYMLPQIEFSPCRDRRSITYLYYQNCFVKVTKNEISKLSYDKLPGYIWEDQMLDRDFELLDEKETFKAEYAEFLTNACRSDQDRIKAMATAIGYMVNTYKDPARINSVVLVDEKISAGNSPEGRTGKGLFFKAISKIRNVVIVDGKNWSIDKNFAFQRLNPGTDLLVFEDIPKKFAFERFHSILSEGMSVEKKGVPEYFLPYSDSPKVGFTTNFVFTATGATNQARLVELEFSDFFRPEYTPYDHFGHTLFEDWSDQEWLRFDNYIICCVKLYFELDKLWTYKRVNLTTRKKLQHFPEEFLDFMEPDPDTKRQLIEPHIRYDESLLEFNKTQDRTHLYNMFKNHFMRIKNEKEFSSKRFYGCIRKFIELDPDFAELEEGKSNGIRWMMFKKLNKENTTSEPEDNDPVPF